MCDQKQTCDEIIAIQTAASEPVMVLCAVRALVWRVTNTTDSGDNVMSSKLGSKVGYLLFAAAAIGVSFTSAARATPITYDFTVNVTSGPLSGTAYDGTFAYDSSSTDPGQWVNGPGLLTAFDFTFNGIAYDTNTVTAVGLSFDHAGVLDGFIMGNACDAEACGIGGTNAWVAVREQNDLTTSFPYSFQFDAPNYADVGKGNITFEVATAGVPGAPTGVPEPGTLGLFGFGLLLGGIAECRRLRCRPAWRAK